MGRLRSDRDAAFICSIADEVTELFGTENSSLYRYYGRWPENLSGKDPVWDEPSSTAFFERYDLPCQWFDWNSSDNENPQGRGEEIDATGYVTLNHLKAAGVPVDPGGEYVAVGDVLAVHTGCGGETFFYDIIQTNREGWINSTDKFTGYSLELKRRNKYVPERKVL